MSSLSIVPLDAPFGAVVEGVEQLSTMTEQQKQDARKALSEHRMIIFRELSPTESEQVEYARSYGELNIYFRKEAATKEHPELLVLSNEPGLPGIAGLEEIPWHTNLSYQPRVAKYAFSHVPTAVPKEAGGGTVWTDTAAAFDDLDTDIKKVVEGLKIHHSQHKEGAEPINVLHDAVRVSSGRKALYDVGPVFAQDGTRPGRGKTFPALPPDESDALLSQLLALSTKPEYQYAHEWRAGDLVIWDNLSTMHMRERVVDNSLFRTIKVADVLEDFASGITPTDVAEARSA